MEKNYTSQDGYYDYGCSYDYEEYNEDCFEKSEED